MDIRAEASYATPFSYSPLFPLLLLSMMEQKHSPDGTEKIKDEYDFIIVGGGAAGSALASRLSEEPCVDVLLIEAGPKPPIISDVPALNGFVLKKDFDWDFKTVAQKYLNSGIRNKKLQWFFGKMLGGSGNHNSMVYVRGNHKNYDDWAAQGAYGWSYEDVLPYFLKLEDNKNDNFLESGYHKAGGPITFQKPLFDSEFKKAVFEAAKELGYDIIDSNGARQTGFYDYQMNIRHGQRCSSVKGYLVPAENRENLDIFLNATVTKIIMEGNQATGVEYYRNGKRQTVKARKEVILSSGTVNTPKLLMLSGIGPRKELEKWNIPVIADLRVGENLQDHGASFYFFTLDPQFSTRKKLSDRLSLEDYIVRRSGPLTNIGIEIVAFLSGLNATTATDFPTYQLYVNEILKPSEMSSGLESKIYKQFFGPIDERRTFCRCVSQQLQPRSRGSVTLSSSDPFDPPIIDPNYLENPKDIDDIVEGLRMCKIIVNTKALQRLGAKPFHTRMPGCEDYASSDEDYFRCFTKRYFGSMYHVVGTAKMGDPTDPTSVVDPELRVKGIKGLRVVDASVMPIIPSGNTHIPTIMIAEKASDIIKKSIKCSEFKKIESVLKAYERHF